jgi:undecaprenyl-diphosphatase
MANATVPLLLVLVVVGLILSRVFRLLGERSARLRGLADQAANLPFFAWVRRRFPRQVVWLRGRLDPSSLRGFALTFTLAVGAVAVWIFAGLTQDVVAHDEAALLDPRMLHWVLARRTAWLTTVMKTVTWLGSNAVIVPVVLLVGAFYLLRRRDWRPGAKLAVAVGGAIVLCDILKAAVHRARPQATVWISLHRRCLPVRPRHPDGGLLRHAGPLRECKIGSGPSRQASDKRLGPCTSRRGAYT